MRPLTHSKLNKPLMSHRDIAKKLGLTKSVVERTEKEALRKLRVALQSYIV